MVEWTSFCWLDQRCYATWMAAFPQIAAALIGLVGAIVAIGAAFVVRNGSLEVARRSSAERRFAAASAFYSELIHCETQLLRDADIVLLTGEDPKRHAPLRPPRTELFDDDRSAVGLLPPTQAQAVTAAYKWLYEMKDRYLEYTSQSDVLFYSASVFSSDAREVARSVHEALETLLQMRLDFGHWLGILDNPIERKESR